MSQDTTGDDRRARDTLDIIGRKAAEAAADVIEARCDSTEMRLASAREAAKLLAGGYMIRRREGTAL